MVYQGKVLFNVVLQMEIKMKKNNELINKASKPTQSIIQGKIQRREILKAAVAGAALFAGGSPAIHAQQKTIRFLNAEPSRDSVKALRVAAAEYERISKVKVVIDTVVPDDAYNKLQASIAAGTPYDWYPSIRWTCLYPCRRRKIGASK